MARYNHRKVLLVSSVLLFALTYDDAVPISNDKKSRKSAVSMSKSSSKGRLAVQVLTRTYIPNITDKKYVNRTKHDGQWKSYDYVPSNWHQRNILTTIRTIRKRNRRGRRRHKRGAKINNDPVYISEFPTNRMYYKMTNKLRLYIRVHLDGTIDGTTDSKDPNIRLVFESHGPSVLRIKGALAQRYLTMNQRGVPTAEKNPSLFNSLFRINDEENGWDTFASFKFYFDGKYDMLIGITKDGHVKKPWKAGPRQDSTQFLSVPC